MRQFYICFVLGVVVVVVTMFVLGILAAEDPIGLAYLGIFGSVLTLAGIAVGANLQRLRWKLFWTFVGAGVLVSLPMLMLLAAGKHLEILKNGLAGLFYICTHMLWGMLMRMLAARRSSYQSKAGFAAALFSLALLSLLMCISAIVRAAGRTY
jgi:hypothetical protein